MTTATKRSHATLAVGLALTVLTLGGAAAPLAAGAQPAPSAGTGTPLPPSKPIHDLKSIAGKWEGRYTSRTGFSEAFGWTINEDGSYEVRPFEQKGLLQITEGQLRFRNLATGRTGIATLHEGGGRRFLRGVSDDGDFSWELTPAATAPLPAERKPAIRVGILTSHPIREPFQRALEALGYVDGKTIALEYRLGPPERLPELAAELVRLNVNIILAAATGPALAAKDATRTVPIVFLSADPLAARLVTSLARPGANLTGVSAVSPDVSAKRLQLLKEAVPGLARVGVLANPTHPAADVQLREIDAAARVLKVKARVFEVRQVGDVEPAFAAMQKEAVDGLVVLTDPVLLFADLQIVRLAAKYRLPTIAESRQYADAGGLISYGPSYADLLRRAVQYVDRILKGAKPADLPVEQPTKFELVINMKTAKALGLTIPPALLLRTDQVIE